MKIQLLKVAFLCSFLCQSLISIAQIKVSTETTCRNIVTNKEIAASVYEFEERIGDCYIDSSRYAAVVQLRGVSKRKQKPSDFGTLLNNRFDH